MKVILTGSTGFIGQEVLEQCLQNSSITSIVALSRRELPPSVVDHNPKLKVTIVDNFLSYPESVLQDINGAEACIWCLGKALMRDNDIARKVSIDYTLAAAKAFGTSNITQQGDGKVKKFRFVYCSGAAAEKDQTKPLWFMQNFRRIRGQVENELLAHAKEHQEAFEACIMRPGMVLSKEASWRSLFMGLGPSVGVGVLAAAMIQVALSGSEDQILDNSAINQLRR